jgi:hypothetical protein
MHIVEEPVQTSEPEWPFESTDQQVTFNHGRRRIYGAAMAAGAIMGAGFYLSGSIASERADNTEDHIVADGYRNCAAFVLNRTDNRGEQTTMRLSRLSHLGELDDCGISPPAYASTYVEVPDKDNDSFLHPSDIAPKFSATDSLVILPAAVQYETAAQNREDRSDFNYLRTAGAAVVGTWTGIVGGYAVAWGISSLSLRALRKKAVQEGRFKPKKEPAETNA